MATSEATLIQCTNSKRDEPAPARDLYDESAYFRAMRKWAKQRPGPWFILSAKHGLVRPSDVLAPYDERGLTTAQAAAIAQQLAADGYDRIHVTAGRDYTDPLIPALERRGLDVINHFSGEPIGRRQKLLKEAVIQ